MHSLKHSVFFHRKHYSLKRPCPTQFLTQVWLRMKRWQCVSAYVLGVSFHQKGILLLTVLKRISTQESESTFVGNQLWSIGLKPACSSTMNISRSHKTFKCHICATSKIAFSKNTWPWNQQLSTTLEKSVLKLTFAQDTMKRQIVSFFKVFQYFILFFFFPFSFHFMFLDVSET